MEATAAAIYTGETQTIAERVNNYIAATKGSIAGIAREINYSRTTISRYLSGKYDSDPSTFGSRAKKLTPALPGRLPGSS